MEHVLDNAVLLVLNRMFINNPQLVNDPEFLLKFVSRELRAMTDHWDKKFSVQEQKLYQSADFTNQLIAKGLSQIFPDGPDSLPLPEPLSKLIWNKIKTVLETKIQTILATFEDQDKRDALILDGITKQQTKILQNLMAEGIEIPKKPPKVKKGTENEKALIQEISYLVTLQTTMSLKSKAASVAQKKPKILQGIIGPVLSRLAGKEPK